MMNEIPKKGDLFPPYFDIENVEISYQGEIMKISAPEQDDYIANAVDCFDEMYDMLERSKKIFHKLGIELERDEITKLLAKARGEK